MRFFNAILIQGLAISLFLSLTTACQSIVPATVPVQLSHTPGAAIRIDETTIDADWVQIAYPDGWRVVRANVSGSPLYLVLVSPDERLRIDIQHVATCPPDDHTPSPDRYQRIACLPNREQSQLLVSGEVDGALAEVYAPLFDAVVASVHFP